jgi:hypothetical protein
MGFFVQLEQLNVSNEHVKHLPLHQARPQLKDHAENPMLLADDTGRASELHRSSEMKLR